MGAEGEEENEGFKINIRSIKKGQCWSPNHAKYLGEENKNAGALCGSGEKKAGRVKVRHILNAGNFSQLVENPA